MKQYLDIVKHVLEHGRWKSPVRKNEQTGKWEPVDGGVRTLTCANVLFRHDMKNGFPLLTTKKMAFRTMCVELEGFIKGITDKSWYRERSCKIWDEWSNPGIVELKFNYVMKTTPYIYCDVKYENELELKKAIQKSQDDLGPIYGYQWRHFGEHHGERYNGTPANGVSQGVDQLKNIVDALTNNPMDRRMVCSSWNPNQIGMMALPPCHTQWGCTVIEDTLHLNFIMRSADVFLGVPFNIASYALMLCLLAEVGGFERGNLSALFTDCHIYENQIEASREQITREPRDLPWLRVITEGPVEAVKRSAMGLDEKPFDIFSWGYKDVELIDYHPHEKLDCVKVVV